MKNGFSPLEGSRSLATNEESYYREVNVKSEITTPPTTLFTTPITTPYALPSLWMVRRLSRWQRSTSLYPLRMEEPEAADHHQNQSRQAAAYEISPRSGESSLLDEATPFDT